MNIRIGAALPKLGLLFAFRKEPSTSSSFALSIEQAFHQAQAKALQLAVKQPWTFLPLACSSPPRRPSIALTRRGKQGADAKRGGAASGRKAGCKAGHNELHLLPRLDLVQIPHNKSQRIRHIHSKPQSGKQQSQCARGWWQRRASSCSSRRRRAHQAEQKGLGQSPH